MRFVAIFIVGSIAAFAGTAGAQGQRLPEVARLSVGTGSNPAVGFDANLKPTVAYISRGTNYIWSPSTGSVVSPVAGHRCAYKGQTVFCEGSVTFPGYPFPLPVMKGFDLSTATAENGPPGSLSDASWGNAVWVNAAGEVRSSAISGTGTLTDTLIGMAAGGAPRPRINGGYGVYQETAGAGWQINYFKLGVGVVASTAVPNEPRPDILDDVIVFQEGNSITWRDANAIWDPKSVNLNPAVHGCTGFYDPKIGVMGVKPGTSIPLDLIVVRAEGCPENPNGSVLYVVDNLFGSYDAYYVGRLGASHEFSVQEDKIAYTDDNGEVWWVHVKYSAL